MPRPASAPSRPEPARCPPCGKPGWEGVRRTRSAAVRAGAGRALEIELGGRRRGFALCLVVFSSGQRAVERLHKGRGNKPARRPRAKRSAKRDSAERSPSASPGARGGGERLHGVCLPVYPSCAGAGCTAWSRGTNKRTRTRTHMYTHVHARAHMRAHTHVPHAAHPQTRTHTSTDLHALHHTHARARVRAQAPKNAHTCIRANSTHTAARPHARAAMPPHLRICSQRPGHWVSECPCSPCSGHGTAL